MTIVGVGRDTPADNAAWAEEEGFAFELWTDDDHTLGVTYSALTSSRDNTVDRVTMVLDADGVLVREYVDTLVVGVHPSEVLEDCAALFGR